jgi:VanZ family protein
VIVALLGMGMSLSIELTQAYLPTRDSSLIDVLMNSLGTILGIALFNCKIFRH